MGVPKWSGYGLLCYMEDMPAVVCSSHSRVLVWWCWIGLGTDLLYLLGANSYYDVVLWFRILHHCPWILGKTTDYIPFFFFFFACNICLEYIQNCVAMACFPCELTRKGTACDGLWPWCHPPAVSVGSPPDDSSVLWFYQSAGFLVLTWTTRFSFLLLGTVSFVVNANHSFNTCFTVSSVAYTHTEFNSCLICMDISITSLYISIRSLYTFIRAV